MPLRHLLLGLAVVAVWGTNFVVIKYALAHLPALTLAALRFALAAFPALLFIRRPAASWGNLAAYGLLIGVAQFGLMFIAMTRFVSPGLASLLAQVQVFFTIGLATLIAGERVRLFQVLAMALSMAGIVLIGWHAVDAGAAVTPLGLVLMLLSALAWASGNIVSRSAGRVDALGYMVWSSVFAVLPLLGLSVALEGWPAIRAGLVAADAATWAAVLWQSVGNTLFGYGVWAWLLARYPAASVTPLALLVPVFGMGASALWLGEPLPGWKIGAALLVLAGLALNLLWPRLQAALVTREG
ncbi:EamA family transporter [Ottowia sp.]|uniref:EamA family transporter n=1 Tax=Ottowia sp. TaxID=1898956 RepID=UPI002CBADB92|nr:EamA family transporter [Ottowia sp.]HOB65898.1 EamA family transporter [Ottowia sp.]HPZ56881.1 EamA family transporter [Ottowia sp.]HQD47759.1 EamA family transporter [Ottowia sp.]